MAENVRAPSIIREGGYQGSRDPGSPDSLMKPQTVPLNHGSDASQPSNSSRHSNH